MKTGINIAFFANLIGMEKAAKYVSDAGFDYLDYTPPVQNDDWEKVMKENDKIFKAYGLTVHQTHAPFNRYGRYGDKTSHYLCLDRCMEATSYFGAKYVAVHGDEFDFNNMDFSPEAALEYNYNYFKPYVEYGEKNGIKMAFETVFEDSLGSAKRRFTSDPAELMSLIKSFDSESAVCCWDFGHANVSFRQNHVEEIMKFGSLIQCTHLHDNCGNDSHQIPMSGDIDWKAVMGAFGKIGYSEVMSVEYSHGSAMGESSSDYIKLTYDLAKYLCDMM